MTTQFGRTVLYVDEVPPVVDFYRRAFGLELRFFDEALGFEKLETGGSTLAIAAHAGRDIDAESVFAACRRAACWHRDRIPHA